MWPIPVLSTQPICTLTYEIQYDNRTKRDTRTEGWENRMPVPRTLGSQNRLVLPFAVEVELGAGESGCSPFLEICWGHCRPGRCFFDLGGADAATQFDN